MKRVVIEYTPRGSDKLRYAAAKLDGYSGDTILLETQYGRMAFSRDDGRWLEGDCLNYLEGHVFEVNKLDGAIRRGNVFQEYEGTSETAECCKDPEAPRGIEPAL